MTNLTLQCGGIFCRFVFSLMLVSSLAGDQPIKSLISACIGLFLAQIGSSPIDGTPRFTFGTTQFIGGIDTVAVIIGMFAIPEILNAARKVSNPEHFEQVNVGKIRGFGFSFGEFAGQLGDFFSLGPHRCRNRHFTGNWGRDIEYPFLSGSPENVQAS